MSQGSDPNTEVERVDPRSFDVAEQKRQELLRLFPEVRTEGGKIDFDRLKLTLGAAVDVGKERYGLTWPGKAECFRTIQTPSTATLRPMRDESVDFDTTGNLIIEGDNLEVLKLLQKAYLGKVKVIYIDPPYNTGNDFIYPDNYTESLQTYLEYTGQVDAEGKKFSTNTEADGRFHSKWLSMMYPRLYLGRNLLTDDGFFVVCIDDAELASVRMLMNEIVGEENFVATLVFDRNRKNDAKLFSVGHEYVVVYAKNKALLTEQKTVLRAPKEGIDEIRTEFKRLRALHGDDWEQVQRGLKEHFETFEADDPRLPLARFTNADERGPFRTDGDASWPGGGGPRYEVLHPVTGKPCKVPSRGWVWSTRERMQEEIDAGNVVFGPDESTVPSVRRYLFERSEEVMRSVIFSYAQKASQDLAKLFGGKKVFDNPKNYMDAARLISYLTNPGDIVLDYFAGSGATLHGVLESNEPNQPIRSFVGVQLPEPVDEDIEAGRNARALGMATISDICRERIRRVLEAKKGRFAFGPAGGFRSLQLAESNLLTWNGDTAADASDVAQQLSLHVHHVRSGRSDDDLLFEVLLKEGFPPTTRSETIAVATQKAQSLAEGALIVCLSRSLDLETIRAIADRGPQRVVCLDEGFSGSDQVKTNAAQIFKTKGIVFRTV
jgi:adenine-specific DNA-methyltransferase